MSIRVVFLCIIIARSRQRCIGDLSLIGGSCRARSTLVLQQDRCFFLISMRHTCVAIYTAIGVLVRSRCCQEIARMQVRSGCRKEMYAASTPISDILLSLAICDHPMGREDAICRIFSGNEPLDLLKASFHNTQALRKNNGVRCWTLGCCGGSSKTQEVDDRRFDHDPR